MNLSAAQRAAVCALHILLCTGMSGCHLLRGGAGMKGFMRGRATGFLVKHKPQSDQARQRSRKGACTKCVAAAAGKSSAQRGEVSCLATGRGRCRLSEVCHGIRRRARGRGGPLRALRHVHAAAGAAHVQTKGAGPSLHAHLAQSRSKQRQGHTRMRALRSPQARTYRGALARVAYAAAATGRSAASSRCSRRRPGVPLALGGASSGLAPKALAVSGVVKRANL